MGESSAIVPTGAPIKTYTVHQTSAWRQSYQEVQFNGRTILWVNARKRMFHNTQVNIQTEFNAGPIVAACKLGCFMRGLRFWLGNPDCTDKDAWPVAECHGFRSNNFTFQTSDCRLYQWRRTHDRDLGAKRFGNKDFKLVDTQTGHVIAVFIFKHEVFGVKDAGRIDYFVEFGQELELMSLTVLMGIQEQIREQERAAAASSGGGASGAAAASG